MTTAFIESRRKCRLHLFCRQSLAPNVPSDYQLHKAHQVVGQNGASGRSVPHPFGGWGLVAAREGLEQKVKITSVVARQASGGVLAAWR
jgi:hypothetical protein